MRAEKGIATHAYRIAIRLGHTEFCRTNDAAATGTIQNRDRASGLVGKNLCQAAQGQVGRTAGTIRTIQGDLTVWFPGLRFYIIAAWIFDAGCLLLSAGSQGKDRDKRQDNGKNSFQVMSPFFFNIKGIALISEIRAWSHYYSLQDRVQQGKLSPA